MPTRNIKGPSERDWESHRPLLERLYFIENKTLSEVMGFMEREHVFFAKRNQYEKYLRHKWKLHKNADSRKWKLISPIIRDLERTGKQFDVWIDGEKKSIATIRKETRRYAHSDHGPSNLALPRKLPQGVIIQKTSLTTLPLITIDLPFHNFERYLCDNLPILTADKKPHESNHAKVWSPETGIVKALEVVAPYELDSSKFFNLPFMTPHTQMFASPLHRNLLFSVANNFAGIGALPMEKVIEFLQHETIEGLYRMIRSAPEYYTTQAIALNLFRASIEVGDAGLVDFLIRESLPGIKPNRFICSNCGTRYTPIERAAALLHKKVVRTLLEHSADVNLSDSGQSRQYGGALNCAARGMDGNWLPKRVTELDLELFEMLVSAGGELEWSTLKDFIQCDTKGDFVHLMISKQAAKRHEGWSKAGVFLHAFRYQNHEKLVEILKIMHENGVDINFHVENTVDGTWPRRVIDVVAGRGDLVMIKYLIGAGGRLTGDSLPCAISSGNEALVHYLLDQGATTNSMGSLQISPLAAAIRLQNRGVLDLIVCHQDLMSLEDRESFRSALQAALEAGDAKWIEYLGNLGGEIRPEDLSVALMTAVKDGREEFALALIDAGADTNISSNSVNTPVEDPPLLEALKRRNAVIVCSLLNADANPNYEDSPGTFNKRDPAIELAVKWGDRRIIQNIIDAGANLNECGGYVGSTPALSIAVKRSDKDMVAMLLHAGCDINNHRARILGKTALTAAVKTGDLDMIHYVLEHGADPHDPNALAEATKQDSAIFDLLLRRHAAHYPNGCTGWGTEVLKEAIDSGSHEIFTRVLEGGADANHCLDRMTLFGYAIAKSKDTGIKFLELLLQQKQKTRYNPETIVSRASSSGRSGEKPLARMTAFLAAIEAAYIPTIELLLRHNADVNFPAEFGVKRTPLQKAAELGDMEIVKLLLKRGADVMAPAAQRGGGTALQLAAFGGYIHIVRLLLEHGADVHAPASKVYGRTALEGAAEQGRLDTVTVLLKAGAGYNGRDRGKFTRAIALAEENSHSHIADLLNQYVLDGRLSNGPPTFEEFLNFDMLESGHLPG